MSNKEMMKKTKLFFSFEKQLNYINEMNKEGWKLVYIKGGCVYHFEKTEPDEYFTILHAATKEKVMEISAFAAQCGYQSIPHTMDRTEISFIPRERKRRYRPNLSARASKKQKARKESITVSARSALFSL